jgi:LuxR family transcriptional regulator, maltose regulon positive regulatory protein
MALARCGQQRASHTALGKLLKQACDEGFVRIIVDEGPTAGLLVHDYAAATQKEHARRADPIFAEYLQRLTDAFGLSPSEATAGEPSKSATLKCVFQRSWTPVSG